jgi:hypothetical protein
MIELTDADEVRFGPGSASLEDAGVLAGWLADRGVEALFRVEEGRWKIDTLRDRLVETNEPTGPSDEPRFAVLVPDGRVRDGWRRTDHEVRLSELAEFASRPHGAAVRFEPVGEPTDG